MLRLKYMEKGPFYHMTRYLMRGYLRNILTYFLKAQRSPTTLGK